MEKKSYKINVTVEFEDVDSFQIVHHTKLIAYLERVRVHFFNDCGVDLSGKEMNLVLYNLNVQFKKTARLLNELVIEMFVDKLEEFRFGLGYRIYRDDELITKASTDLAFLDPITKGIIPVPDSFKEQIKEYV